MIPTMIHVPLCPGRTGVTNLFEPAHTSGILALDDGFNSNMDAMKRRVNHNMVVLRGTANHKNLTK